MLGVSLSRMAEEKHHEGWWRLCDHCRDRLGIYEALLVRHPDGRVDRTSYLNLPDHLREALTACFHAGCLRVESELE